MSPQTGKQEKTLSAIMKPFQFALWTSFVRHSRQKEEVRKSPNRET